jgi:RNA polymerase sigma-70 factor, ECF subfamily
MKTIPLPQSDAELLAELEAKTDEELLLLYRDAGERRAFDALVHRYERELYSYLRRYLGDEQLAEDVFQATFLQVHLKNDQFDEGRAFRPWMYTIATNQAIDAQRRTKRHKLPSLDVSRASGDEQDLKSLVNLLISREPAPVLNLEADERREWIRRQVDELPKPLRDAVILVYYQGMKYKDAAEVLSIPVGTVKSRLHAAILKLNEAWNQTQAVRD